MNRLVRSVSYLQSCSDLVTALWMDAHVVELVYTPVPKGRVTATSVRAQVQPVEHPWPEARHPEQLPSQHQGAEGPDLGRCSDTRDP